MAEAAVVFLLENLNRLLLHHASLLHDAKSLIENLIKDLLLFEAFLTECKDDLLREMIRDVVCDAEDVIDAFFTMAVVSESKNYFKRAFDSPERLLIVAKEVETIGAKVRNICDRKSVEFVIPMAEKIPEKKKDPLVRRVNDFGFEDEKKYAIQYLTRESKELDVFTMIGLPGLGITTLARMIFCNPIIKYEFPTRIWVRVSQNFRSRDVFLSILSNFTKITDDIYRKNDHDVVKFLLEKLESSKFLIVMDDVRTAVAWTELLDAFPMTYNRGKILITCYAKNFLPDSYGPFLTHVDQCVLHQLAVSCTSLPKCFDTWRFLHEVSDYGYLNVDLDEQAEKIFSLTYRKLPFYLRPCFLYFGMFPEDFEIPVQKLILMWIAEGFVQSKPSISLEETAKEYLEDLISRNLVMVDKVSSEGKIKTCRIHDKLREFCQNEAGKINENFFQEMKMASGGIFEPSLYEFDKLRRLCIHSNVLNFFKAKPFGPRARSFLCFSKKEITLLPEDISSIPIAFKLLRVLEGESIKFTKFPSDLAHLIHLRYLVLSSDFEVLPKIITKLCNLQTLIVCTTSPTLDINANIWKMIELRHLKINASSTLLKKGKAGGQKLQTLGEISPQSCTEEFFDRACGLKKLGVRGRIITFVETGGLEKLVNLDKLKLVNDMFPPCGSRLPYLPKPYKFPPRLRRLTLYATNLDWTHMFTLGMLDTLEVLKLKNRAFVGMRWETADGGFRLLKILHIERTDLVDWLSLGHHFPQLESLVLRNCEKLEAIPIGLAKSLQNLELDCVSKSASRYAREIEKIKYFEQGTETSKRSGFKLYIGPEAQ